jgi:hypothetical protein
VHVWRLLFLMQERRVDRAQAVLVSLLRHENADYPAQSAL